MARAYLKDPENFTGFKRGIDLSGGTILVYEVDQDASRQQASGPADQGPSGRAKADASPGRRPQAADRPDRPAGRRHPPDRREPGRDPDAVQGPQAAARRGPAGPSDVEYIKGLIREVGSLEFRILANQTDDAKAIADAQDYFERAAKNPDGDEAKALDNAARAGLPPPFPNKTAEDVDEYMVDGRRRVGLPGQYALGRARARTSGATWG